MCAGANTFARNANWKSQRATRIHVTINVTIEWHDNCVKCEYEKRAPKKASTKYYFDVCEFHMRCATELTVLNIKLNDDMADTQPGCARISSQSLPRHSAFDQSFRYLDLIPKSKLPTNIDVQKYVRFTCVVVVIFFVFICHHEINFYPHSVRCLIADMENCAANVAQYSRIASERGSENILNKQNRNWCVFDNNFWYLRANVSHETTHFRTDDDDLTEFRQRARKMVCSQVI